MDGVEATVEPDLRMMVLLGRTIVPESTEPVAHRSVRSHNGAGVAEGPQVFAGKEAEAPGRSVDC